MTDNKLHETDIIARIQDLYPDAVIDVAGADCNFEVYVISDAFSDKGLLQRQQSILALFKQELTSGQLHALSVKARTPAEQAGTTGLVQITTTG